MLAALTPEEVRTEGDLQKPTGPNKDHLLAKPWSVTSNLEQNAENYATALPILLLFPFIY